MFQACKTCLLLGTLFVTFAFNVWAQTYVGDNQQVVVSVYDDAGVSARTLVQAERKAGRIFEHAGLDVVWKNCASSTKHIGPESEGCAGFNWPTHLAVRVLPQSAYSTNEVFGMAFLSAGGTGCYSDVFYDRAAELQTAWNVDLADILGNVMAHELGHLLLGSNSHASTGIMRARWSGRELKRMARGNLLFTAEQGEQMRARFTATRSPLAITAQSSH